MRPAFHFTPEHGWLNDPHGVTVQDGLVHVFYQAVPDTPEWRPDVGWGHAAGPDLFSLGQRPHALGADDGDDGAWTGCLVPDAPEGPRILYTAASLADLSLGSIRSAAPTDGRWDGWRKGPVVLGPPAGAVHFRDPFVFRDEDVWWMLVGAGLEGDVAALLAYRSTDFAAWEPAGVAASRRSALREPAWLGSVWECPQLLRLPGGDVLLASVWHESVTQHVAVGVGAWRDGRFDDVAWSQIGYGPGPYAPTVFRDAAGRPCVLFWLRGPADAEAGWAGALSLPYVVSLAGGRLVLEPHPDLGPFRGPVAADGVVPDAALEVVWTPGERGALEVLSAGGAVLRLDVAGGVLTARRHDEAWPMPHAGGPVRLVVDGPVAEVVAPAGLLGLTVDPAPGGMRVVAEAAEVRPLRR